MRRFAQLLWWWSLGWWWRWWRLWRWWLWRWWLWRLKPAHEPIYACVYLIWSDKLVPTLVRGEVQSKAVMQVAAGD